jgi:hypothetical protein
VAGNYKGGEAVKYLSNECKNCNRPWNGEPCKGCKHYDGPNDNYEQEYETYEPCPMKEESRESNQGRKL